MKQYEGVYIDGAWQPSTGTVATVINPATEEPFGTVTNATADDVDRAVQSAARALPGWAATPLEERIAVVERIAALIDERSRELALLRVGSMGSPLKASLTLSNSAGLIRMYLDTIRKVQFTQVRSDEFGTSYITRRPVGVVAGIVPWNVPVRNELRKLIPSILTGCSIVLKPALESPLTGAMLMEIFTDAGLPAGVANMVNGDVEAGEALVQHPTVRKIAFTGSTATGQRIAAVAAPQFKRLQFELGGKSAAIVCADADMGVVIPSLLSFGFGNSGQICASLTRVLVPRSMQDELVAALVTGAQRQVVGDPMDEATTMGPLVTQVQRDRVLEYVQSGIDQGATLATGGKRPAGLDRGWFVEPTVFANVDNSMRIAQEEIFGPVVSVIPYDTEDEAIAIANDSRYGLHGAVFAADAARALELAMRVDTGTSAINSFDLPINAPFGGTKDSGVGRENGVEGYDTYLEYMAYKVPEDLAAKLR